jgi:hypothetical protein
MTIPGLPPAPRSRGAQVETASKTNRTDSPTHRAKGRFCISIDLELGWGIWDVPDAAYMERCLRLEHDIVTRLLDAFHRHDVCATWAVVGRLLDPGGPHPEGWDSRVWYAPEIVRLVRNAATTQEIGSHSFEHVYFDRCDEAAARSDLERARALHDREGLEWTSFVFPRNGVAHLPELRRAGLRVFRGADEGAALTLARRLPTVLGRALRLAAQILPLPVATVRARPAAAGLIELPGSMLLPQRRGARRLISPFITVARAVNAMGRACAEESVFHLWFHPSNFYFDTDVQFDILERILERAAALRTEARLEIVPMRHFANVAGLS